MKKFVLMGVVGVFLSSGAMAADQGPFVEAAVGSVKFVDGSDGWNMNDTSTSLGVIGGYMFNQNVGVEAGYIDLGKASGSISGTVSGYVYGKLLNATGTVNVEGKTTGFKFGFRGVLPVNDTIKLSASAGVLSWKIDGTMYLSAAGTWGGSPIAASTSASDSISGRDAYYGIGAGYSLNKNVVFGLGYTTYKLKDAGVGADNFDVSLNYRF